MIKSLLALLLVTLPVAEARFDLSFQSNVTLQAKAVGAVPYRRGERVPGFGLSRGPSAELWLTRLDTPDGFTHGYSFCQSSQVEWTETGLKCDASHSSQPGTGIELQGQTTEQEEERVFERLLGSCTRCLGYSTQWNCWWMDEEQVVGTFQGKVHVKKFELERVRLVGRQGQELAASTGLATGEWRRERVLESSLIKKERRLSPVQCVPQSGCFGSCWGEQ